MFKDSLFRMGVDTILVLKKECIGCPSKIDRDIFFIWKQNNIGFLQKISGGQIADVKHIQDPFQYFEANREEILKEQLKKPNYILSHYNELIVSQYIEDDIIDFSFIIPEYFRNNDNINSKKLLWINYIEGQILNAYW